jgi:hypothetical protein
MFHPRRKLRFSHAWGVRLALEWMSRPIEIETDCLGLVKALKSDVNMWAGWTGILSEIKARFRLFTECKVTHVRQEANIAAHALAQLAKGERQCTVLRRCAPSVARVIFDQDRRKANVLNRRVMIP